MDRNKRLNKVILVKKTVRVNFSLLNPSNIKATISFVNMKPNAKIIIEITNNIEIILLENLNISSLFLSYLTLLSIGINTVDIARPTIVKTVSGTDTAAL